MKSCVTVSLVPEARGGPFVFWGDLPAACAQAAQLGFDAIEIFPPGAAEIDRAQLRELLAQHSLSLAALGTGAGWVKHKWTLTSANAEVRQRARDFVRQMIGVAADFGAAVIVGSMQGRFEGEVTRPQALEYLQTALAELGETAARQNVTILYEHLNRYETNVLNRIEEVVPFLAPLPPNVKILADLFHMNIEEENLAGALRAAGDRLGHVHLADSNRRPAGLGHTDFVPIFRALQEMKYQGYLSAEALPYPDSAAAAAQTIRAFRNPPSGHSR